MASGPIISWQIDGKTMETVTDFIFLGSKITTDSDCSHKIKRCLCLGTMTNLDNILKSRDIILPAKVHIVKAMVFSCSCVWMWDNKEGWVLKNWCFWTLVLEKTLESPLDSKEIQPVHPKGNQSWMAIHSSTLAWQIPWMEEPGGLQSMGSLGVGHDWATSLSLFTFMHWRRKWQPTPAFLPGESQGRGSLVGCHLWGRTESDTTEAS